MLTVLSSPNQAQGLVNIYSALPSGIILNYDSLLRLPNATSIDRHLTEKYLYMIKEITYYAQPCHLKGRGETRLMGGNYRETYLHSEAKQALSLLSVAEDQIRRMSLQIPRFYTSSEAAGTADWVGLLHLASYRTGFKPLPCGSLSV